MTKLTIVDRHIMTILGKETPVSVIKVDVAPKHEDPMVQRELERARLIHYKFEVMRDVDHFILAQRDTLVEARAFMGKVIEHVQGGK